MAYGRPSPVSASLFAIRKDAFTASAILDLDSSTVREERPGGRTFCSVQVFPVVLAPDRVRILAQHSLADAFKRFVIEDPEVAAIAREGMKLAPKFEAVFRRGRCFVSGVAEWPVDSERWSITCYDRRDPIEIAVASETLVRRYRALVGVLRQGDLEAYGLAGVDGRFEGIPRSIWGHEDFYISVQGDVLHINVQCENLPFDFLTRRWVAVELRAPNTVQPRNADLFHVKPTTSVHIRSNTGKCDASASLRRSSKVRRSPKADAVAAALERKGITQRPAGLTDKEIAKKIAPELSDQHMSPDALSKAVGRHFNKHKPLA